MEQQEFCKKKLNVKKPDEKTGFKEI